MLSPHATRLLAKQKPFCGHHLTLSPLLLLANVRMQYCARLSWLGGAAPGRICWRKRPPVHKIMALNLRALFLALIMFSQVYLTTCYSMIKLNKLPDRPREPSDVVVRHRRSILGLLVSYWWRWWATWWPDIKHSLTHKYVCAFICGIERKGFLIFL